MSTSFCSWLLGCVLLVGVQSGRPLTEALQELQKQGLALVFTSRLVTPDMKVLAEPVASDPRARAEALLAPYGLTVLEEAPGLLVVVRAEGPAPPAAVTHGRPPPPLPLPVLREEIVVRPSRLTLLAERPEPSSFGLDREAIERLPHLGDDLFRAASLLPGIAANDISAELSVRGGRPDELKIVLDGQELYGAYHLEDYANALSIVPARLLGSASLITGALPASQGDRMSGLLDLRTLDPPAGRRLVLGLSVLDALASSAGSFRSVPGGWLLTARRGSLELARRAIGNEHPEFWDVLGKVETTTPFGVVGAHLLLAGDHLGIDRSVAGDSEHLANNYRTDHGWLTHQAGNERLLVSTLASWARLERSRGGATSEEKGDFSLRDRRRLRALGLVQTWNLQHPSGSLEWGWEGHRYEAFFDYMQRRDPAIVILSPLAAGRPTALAFRGELRSNHYGVWARDLRSWGERVTTEVGARYDHHSATGDDLLSPRLSVGWRLGEQSIMRFAWGRFFQSQRPYELQVGDGETRLHRAERSDQWVVSYETWPRHTDGRIATLRLELYRRQVEHPRPRWEGLLEPVNFFPEIEPDRVRVAPRRSRERGVELLVRGTPGRRTGWWAAYAWAQASDEIDGRRVPRPLDQRHTLTLGVDRQLPHDWRLDLAWRWHTGWPTTPVVPGRVTEDVAFASFGPLESRRLSPYHRLDLRASKRWQLSHGALTFFVDVQNLYARRNPAGFDVVTDDRTGHVRLDEEGWPGIVPSLGVTWQLGD